MNSASNVSCPSSSLCYADTPPGTGTVDITATVGAQTSATSSVDKFTYAPAPSVASVSPRAGSTSGGTSVTVTGSGFTGATGVAFGGTLATSFTVNSNTSITAPAPSGPAGTVVDVTVTTAVGTSGTDAVDSFTFLSLGDVNADGHVTSVDALCVLRQVVGLSGTSACPQPLPGNPIIATNETSANGPTSVDALCILRGVAGLPGTSSCPAITGSVAQPAGTAPSSEASSAVAASSAAEGHGSAAAQARVTLSNGKVLAASGSRVSVQVESRVGQDSLGAWTVDVLYDAGAVKASACTAGGESICNLNVAPGVVRISGASAAGLAGQQTLATITFEGLGQKTGNSALSVRALTLTDPEGMSLTTEAAAAGPSPIQRP